MTTTALSIASKNKVEGQASQALPALSQNASVHLLLSSHWSEMCCMFTPSCRDWVSYLVFKKSLD